MLIARHRPSAKADFDSIQYLRFVAASMVVMVHAFQQVARYLNTPGERQFEFGAAGVDIFFVISGFLMVFITQSREKSAGQFLAHRFLRVGPIYWIITLATCLIALVAPQVFYTTVLDLPHIIASMLFIAWPHPIMKDAWPVFTIGWTLNYEFAFYVIFSVALVINHRRRLAITSAILALLVLGGAILQPENAILAFYTNPILLEFIFGMLAAECVIKGYHLRLGASIILLVAFAIVVTVEQMASINFSRVSSGRVLYWGIPATMLFVAAVSLDIQGYIGRSRVLRLLGDASYSIYLTHMFCVGFLGIVWKKLPVSGAVGGATLAVACLLLSWAAGTVFHLLVEKPAVNAAKRMVLTRASRPRSDAIADKPI